LTKGRKSGDSSEVKNGAKIQKGLRFAVDVEGTSPQKGGEVWKRKKKKIRGSKSSVVVILRWRGVGKNKIKGEGQRSGLEGNGWVRRNNRSHGEA